MGKGYKEQVSQPSMQALSFDERLALIVDRELYDRENRKLIRNIKNAKLRHPARIEELNYHSSRGLEKQIIANLAECSWINSRQNLIITGPTGAGKSWLACAFATQACRRGHSALYKGATLLYEELKLAIGDGSLPRYRSSLAKVKVLILDDFGLSSVDPVVGHILLDIIDQRLHSGSLIITSQLPTENWHSMFNDPTLADAILDRIVHRSHRISLRGESMRKLIGMGEQPQM